MASTKIQNLPLKAPIGAMKIPTGGFGDYSITVSSIGDFIIDTFNLATKDYVDTLLIEKEDRIDTTGGYLTPTSQNSNVPDTTNDVIDGVAQALLDRIEYVKDNFSAAPSHNELLGRSATGAHPSTSISHKSGTVYTYLQQNESDINNINNVSIPTINQTLVNKQDLIETGGALTPTATQSPVPSVSHTGLNSAIQALLNRTEWVKNNNNVKSVNTKTGDVLLTPSDIATVGSNKLNATPQLSDVPELVDKNGVKDTNANAQAQALLNNFEYLRKNTQFNVDSIEDLVSLSGFSDGSVVFVKSYHKDFNKGGGYFLFDSSKSSLNNGVNIFNGWIRISEPTVIDAFDAGCLAVGDHTSFLDHEGMRRIAQYITDQYAVGITEFRVVLPKGNYIVQKQSLTLTSDFRQLTEDSFRITALPNLKLTLEYDNSTFTVRNGLRVGSFNRSDWSKYTGASPFYGNSSTFFMTPNHPFVIADINTLVVRGIADWDGNTPNLIVGGYYGDNGIQWSGNGCYFANIDRLVIDADIKSHDHSGDGFYIAGRNPVDVKEDLNDGRYMYIRGLEATRNGRNGISFVGGKNSSWYDCKSYKNGLSDHPTASNPRSNLDIEAEVSAIRRARFYNFKSNQAGADGVVSAFQDARDVIFYDSEFINKQRSVWIEKPQFKFYNCYFNGSIIGGYATTVEADRTRYIECTFEDDITKNPGMPTAPYLIQQNAKNPIFESCTFNSYLGKLFWVSSTPQGKYTTLKDCVINFYAHVPDSMFGTYEFDGVNIYDKRSDPSVSMNLAISNAIFKNVEIHCDTQLSAITFSGTNNFDVYPQNLNQYVKTVASNYQASRFESPMQLMPRYTTSFLYPEASFIGFAYLNAITDLKRNVLYRKGDTFHCTDPVAQNGVIKWVCTTGGYYNTTGWAASTAYTVNTYVNANGKVYKCTVAGTSGTIAPNHTSGTATDGTVTWEYVGLLAVFTAYGANKAATQAASTATDVAGLQADFNALLTKLKNAGIMN